MDQTTNFKKFYGSQTYEVQLIISEFTKPIMQNVFFKNIYALRDGASSVPFSNNVWTMRPERFCLDYYGESYFYPVILLINDIGTVFNFRPDKMKSQNIIAPSYDKITSLANTIID